MSGTTHEGVLLSAGGRTLFERTLLSFGLAEDGPRDRHFSPSRATERRATLTDQAEMTDPATEMYELAETIRHHPGDIQQHEALASLFGTASGSDDY